jgi:ABC-2 type transport system permease protein
VSFLLRTASKDLRRRLRDPLGLVLWFAIPTFIGVALKLAFGGGSGAPPKAHVLVVDEDDSVASRLLLGALRQGGDNSPFVGERVSAEEGERRIQAGEATARLIVPKGFGQAVIDEQPTTLRLTLNPAQRILPQIVKTGVELLPDVVFYGQRFFGAPLRAVSGLIDTRGALADADISRTTVEVQRAVSTLRRMLGSGAPFTLEIKGEEKEKAAAAPRPGVGDVLLPSLLFMALFFVASSASGDVWIEKEMGTLRRALQAPRGIAVFFAGKLLAGAVLFAAMMVFAGLVGRWGFGVSMARLPAAVVWSTATGIVFLLLLTLAQLYAGSQRTAGFLVNLVTLPLLMIGGSFFPFEAMPEGMARIGKWTPNGWALVQLKDILAGALSPAAIGMRLLALALVSGVLFVLAVRRLGGRFAREA